MEEEGSELDPAVRELRGLRELRRQRDEIVTQAGGAREVLPWLQFTRWPNYLHGLNLFLHQSHVMDKMQACICSPYST